VSSSTSSAGTAAGERARGSLDANAERLQMAGSPEEVARIVRDAI